MLKKCKKNDGKGEFKLNIFNLKDAFYAATTSSEKCTLILTQGSSAEAFARCGVSVVGHDYYGIYPLEGKLCNVREASNEELRRDAEIQNIKKILGLEDDKVYENVKELRYGHLMIMADWDYNGSHFKALLINFLHFFWPSLLKVPNFMLDFIPPIVKASTKMTTMKNVFYSMAEYEAWNKKLENKATEYQIKYFKGLASSNSEEVREYFADLNQYTKEFVWTNDEDGDAIEIAFGKMKTGETKYWLRAHQADHSKEKHIRYRDFINKELFVFSNQMSIPSIVDGLNLLKRKILFCAFKKPITKKTRVYKFSRYVSVNSDYHQDNTSLIETIIGMAQNYAGSNNINLLQPNGHFGTRLMGGKDHSSARDIFTQLSPITRYIFPKSDEHLLHYLSDSGQFIEPAWFIPIIPMVLVNGGEGIGTGWSSFIPRYNPRDIIANLIHLLKKGEAMVPMIPWFKCFKGSIQKEKSGYTTRGNIEEIEGKNALKITELPVGMCACQYEKILKAAIEDGNIEAYMACHDGENVNFEITMTEDQMNTAKKEGLWKKCELTTSLSTANMHLFNEHGVIKKYDTPEQILEEFFDIRLRFYDQRMTAQLCELEKALKLLKNKESYIRLVCDGDINLVRTRVELLNEFEKNGLEKLTEVEEEDEEDEDEEDEVAAAEEKTKGTGYHYLLSMSIGLFTEKKIEELKHERNEKQQEIDALKKIGNSKLLWLSELVALDQQLDNLDVTNEETTEAPKKKAPTKLPAASSFQQRANKKRRLE